jgi:hypothetical protein
MSLTYSSVKLYYSQRLGRYSDIDPPIKNIFFVIPLILLQNLAFISVWVVITAYLEVYTLLCVLSVMFVVFIIIGCTSNSVILREKAVCDGTPRDQVNSETKRLFAITVFTSWVSPCIVLSNNRQSRHLNLKYVNSKEISWFKMIGYKINDFWLVLTSTSSIFALLICLFSTWLSIYLKQIDYSFSKSTDVPISHCFKSNTTDFGFFYYENETVQEKANFLYICYENHCKPLVRICDKNETETDIINWIHIVCNALETMSPCSMHQNA